MRLVELIQTYGGEQIERPALDGDADFEFRGYHVTIVKDHGAFKINYDPMLPKSIAHRYYVCTNLKQGREIAEFAIEIACKRVGKCDVISCKLVVFVVEAIRNCSDSNDSYPEHSGL